DRHDWLCFSLSHCLLGTINDLLQRKRISGCIDPDSAGVQFSHTDHQSEDHDYPCYRSPGPFLSEITHSSFISITEVTHRCQPLIFDCQMGERKELRSPKHRKLLNFP